MPKAPLMSIKWRQQRRRRFTFNPISTIQERYRLQRQRRLRRRRKEERQEDAKRRALEEKQASRIHPIYLAYTPEDIAVMTDRDLLNHLFDLYTPMSQPFWEEEADYLFRMMCAICHRMDELE